MVYSQSDFIANSFPSLSAQIKINKEKVTFYSIGSCWYIDSGMVFRCYLATPKSASIVGLNLYPKVPPAGFLNYSYFLRESIPSAIIAA